MVEGAERGSLRGRALFFSLAVTVVVSVAEKL